MKYTYKLLSVAVLLIAAACTDNISSLNVNPKSYTKVPGQMLFTTAQRALVNAMTSGNVNQGIFRLTAQQWTETTYLDETQYDLSTRNIPQNFWSILYRDVLKDLQESARLLAADPASATKSNQLAMIDIMAVYSYSVLVNTFGDVPYSTALDFNNLTPAYDDAAAIYSDLITRLDADIAALSTTGAGFGAGQDIMYNGNVTRWIKFATSLKLRLAMTIADSDPVKSKAAAESAAAGNLILANADNGVITYLNVTPNTNPVWVDLVQSGRQDFVAGKTIIELIQSYGYVPADTTGPYNVTPTPPVPASAADPRMAVWFTMVPYMSHQDYFEEPLEWFGGNYGVGNSFANFSKNSTAITAQTVPGVLLDAAETEFYLAEAAARGYAVGGTADTHYASAITNSILYWGGTAAEALAYVTRPEVAYLTAAGTYKQKIGHQKYIALFNRGFEAWTEIRRFDFPVMNPVTQAKSGFPNRYIYPVSEQNLNTASFNAAAAKVAGGTDKVEAKLFWDKF